MIGIIGGVGPYAGLDLVSKILDNTRANHDQEHIPLLLWSLPNQISDRTEYLEGKSTINPGIELARLTKQAISSGARAIGIPCNTAHVPDILNHVSNSINAYHKKVVLVNMVEEVTKALLNYDTPLETIGILSTNGTYQSGLYKTKLSKAGFRVLRPDNITQREVIHPAIYATYGIKAFSNPVTDRAANDIKKVAWSLIMDGAQAIVLACSELPLVFPGEHHFEGVPLIDSTKILARALIWRVCPEKLKP